MQKRGQKMVFIQSKTFSGWQSILKYISLEEASDAIRRMKNSGITGMRLSVDGVNEYHKEQL